MTQTAMCWGIDTGDGWYNIIYSACRLIQFHINEKRRARARALKYNRLLDKALKGNEKPLSDYYHNIYRDNAAKIMFANAIKNPKMENVPAKMHQISFTQVKEKFATLRIYTDYSDDYIDGVLDMASAASSKTCEVCGAAGKIYGQYWLYALCSTHATDRGIKEDECAE